MPQVRNGHLEFILQSQENSSRNQQRENGARVHKICTFLLLLPNVKKSANLMLEGSNFKNKG